MYPDAFGCREVLGHAIPVGHVGSTGTTTRVGPGAGCQPPGGSAVRHSLMCGSRSVCCHAESSEDELPELIPTSGPRSAASAAKGAAKGAASGTSDSFISKDTDMARRLAAAMGGGKPSAKPAAAAGACSGLQVCVHICVLSCCGLWPAPLPSGLVRSESCVIAPLAALVWGSHCVSCPRLPLLLTVFACPRGQ